MGRSSQNKKNPRSRAGPKKATPARETIGLAPQRPIASAHLGKWKLEAGSYVARREAYRTVGAEAAIIKNRTLPPPPVPSSSRSIPNGPYLYLFLARHTSCESHKRPVGSTHSLFFLRTNRPADTRLLALEFSASLKQAVALVLELGRNPECITGTLRPGDTSRRVWTVCWRVLDFAGLTVRRSQLINPAGPPSLLAVLRDNSSGLFISTPDQSQPLCFLVRGQQPTASKLVLWEHQGSF